MRCFNVAFREYTKVGAVQIITLYCVEVDSEKATFLCYNTLLIDLSTFDYEKRSELLCVDSGDLLEIEFDDNGCVFDFKIY